ncbi:hypothetical protein [Zavarzinia aquatilis]|uniref:Uncharacterized protein n=1 Tax=Zavarzinia aquatilis TaxID=2211142 RepID=A0A317EI97_9PROT|nr:hypothetical protein [Zavarzinia aquatilis]PWR24955.1 hypothetical protein DKG74_04085 [Zavarzinia aquatilis]
MRRLSEAERAGLLRVARGAIDRVHGYPLTPAETMQELARVTGAAVLLAATASGRHPADVLADAMEAMTMATGPGQAPRAAGGGR